ISHPTNRKDTRLLALMRDFACIRFELRPMIGQAGYSPIQNSGFDDARQPSGTDLAEGRSMRGMRRALMALTLLVWPAAAQADLKIFACVPEWGSLARTIGGERVHVTDA